ncbi:hypothetical protein EJD97_001585, partial [Solanum chilense]
RNASRILKEEIANAGVPPRGDQVPHLEEDVNDDQTTQSESMTAQANQEVVPHPHQQVATMASRLRDFTQINHPTFYGCIV